MSRRILIGALFLFLLSVPLTVWGKPIGSITYIEGNVDIQIAREAAREVRLGDPVSPGDVLRAKSKSKAEVTFTDGNVLRLAQNTRIKLSRYEGESSPDGLFDLFRGKVQCLIIKLEKGKRFEVQTPTSIVGVRGTDFFAYHQHGISGAIFREGIGYGYNRNLPQEIRTIQAGQTMLVTAPHLPPVVRPATPVEVEKHLKDTAPPKDKTPPKRGPGDKDAADGQGTGSPGATDEEGAALA